MKNYNFVLGSTIPYFIATGEEILRCVNLINCVDTKKEIMQKQHANPHSEKNQPFLAATEPDLGDSSVELDSGVLHKDISKSGVDPENAPQIDIPPPSSSSVSKAVDGAGVLPHELVPPKPPKSAKGKGGSQTSKKSIPKKRPIEDVKTVNNWHIGGDYIDKWVAAADVKPRHGQARKVAKLEDRCPRCGREFGDHDIVTISGHEMIECPLLTV